MVDVRQKKIWVDGVDITGLTPDSHPFRFVEMLAARRGVPVSTTEITSKLSFAREDGDTAARQAKNAAKRIIVEAMSSGPVLRDKRHMDMPVRLSLFPPVRHDSMLKHPVYVVQQSD